jgi:amidase
LHIVAPPRQDARALQVAALFEKMSGLDKLLPIAPRPGSVPPAESA